MANRIRPKTQTKLHLDEWLELRGYGYEDFGAKLETSYHTVRRWARGERYPDNRTLRAIAEALEISESDLMRSPSEASEASLLAGFSEQSKAEIMNFIQFQRRKESGAG